MPRPSALAIVVITALFAATAGSPFSHVVAQATPRLVVFEGFMRPT